jgi:hypothetical protein
MSTLTIAADAAQVAVGMGSTDTATMAIGKAVAFRVAGPPPFWRRPTCASS